MTPAVRVRVRVRVKVRVRVRFRVVSDKHSRLTKNSLI